MKRFLTPLVACAVIVAGAAWVLSRPDPIMPDYAAGHVPDAQNGALVFAAAGCASCHAGVEADDKRVLSGGHPFVSPFGTFYAPNISPGPQGIGGWSLPEFARAVTRGVSPDGRHYYPAFPYTSYIHMTESDVADLYAHMGGLPVSDQASTPHDVGFPFNIRRGLGLWKLLYLKDDFVMAGPLPTQLARGRYLVEGPGHCAECHTPRTAIGGLQRARWLTGAPNPSGKGTIPAITAGHLGWSEGDLVAYFTSGLTPEYDSVGGTMAAVVDNLAQLSDSDRAAIAAYLLALP